MDNLPAYYARTATAIFCQVTLPYVLEIANKGIRSALFENKHLRNGVTTYNGLLTLEETAIKHKLPYTEMTLELLM